MTSKNIREYSLEINAISKACEAFVEANPGASTYFFVTLPDDPMGTLDGGSLAKPKHAVMLVQAVGDTIEKSGGNWDIKALMVFGKGIAQLCTALFGSHVEESLIVSKDKGVN